MANRQPTHEEIEAQTKRVETSPGVQSPVSLWMQLTSFTEDYLTARGMLSLVLWRAAAAAIGVDDVAFRTAFDDTAEEGRSL